MTVANKVTIISGASGGLGAVVSQKFHQAGAAVVLVGTRPDAVETLADELGRERALPIAANLAEPAGATEVVAATLKHFGRVDILLNLAGGFSGGKLTGDSALADLERMLDINVRTTYHLCRAAVKPMIDQNWGRIVNTGSRAALRGQAGLSAYAMSKAAVLRLTESLAAELKDSRITTSPLTPFYPAPSTLRPTARVCPRPISANGSSRLPSPTPCSFWFKKTQPSTARPSRCTEGRKKLEIRN